MPVRRTVLAIALAGSAGLPGIAAGAVEFGQSTTLSPAAPDGGAGPCPGSATTCTVALVRDASGRVAGAPADGVLVRVRVRGRAGVDGTFTPRVLRPPDPGPPAPGDLILAGVLEADADGDGHGDESQDACPLDAGRSTPCEVDLAVAASAPAFGVDGQLFDHVFALSNAGPSPAADVEIRLAPVAGGELRAVAAPGACVSDGAGMRCTVGRVEPGAGAVVRLTLAGAAGAVVHTAATVSSPLADRGPGNESASATTTLTAPSVAPPQRLFVPVACANLISGTGDDEVLSGTGFGDRLLGGAGRDLIRGAGGADCLEGGAGGDVLDGEDGNDRLAGNDGHDRLRGGSGDDSLRGGLRNDVLIGGPGRDVLLGGMGKDRYDAGPGNDVVDARDGVGESIDCGRGLDTVRVDRRDRFRGCERVRRR